MSLDFWLLAYVPVCLAAVHLQVAQPEKPQLQVCCMCVCGGGGLAGVEDAGTAAAADVLVCIRGGSGAGEEVGCRDRNVVAGGGAVAGGAVEDKKQVG